MLMKSYITFFEKSLNLVNTVSYCFNYILPYHSHNTNLILYFATESRKLQYIQQQRCILKFKQHNYILLVTRILNVYGKAMIKFVRSVKEEKSIN